ncbi:MAG TPA: methyltransferase domain-containing protein [Pyrinomonadaceae bacterium]|jgi:2-polyprenyl-3-methyl-5-hydroxy-6-metoxy-1,4-benzoquinol methylase
MIETQDSEINIELLMERIREAAAGRKAGNGTSLIDASAVLHGLLKSNGKPSLPAPVVLPGGSAVSLPSASATAAPLHITELKLQAEFEPRADDHYHVNDLLRFHDAEFIRNAYRAILKRDPDDAGFAEFLSNLRSGRFNKIDVLASLRFSPEGRAQGVRVDSLTVPAFLRRLYRVPALGYLAELIVSLVRLPVLLRSQRQLEAYSVGQDERLAGHLNLSNALIRDALAGQSAQWARWSAEWARELRVADERRAEEIAKVAAELTRMAGDFSKTITELMESHQKVTALQHQQLGALFREQQEIVEEQKRLRADVHAYLGAEEERARQQREAQEKYDERLLHAGAQYETLLEVIEARVGEVARTLQQTRMELVMQGRRLTMMLEEARRRLPGDLAQAQLETFAREEPHVLDVLYASFEDHFRGSRQDIKERFRIYVPLLREAGLMTGILDIGCGRGEWLEVLAEEGFEARGVELNLAMVEQCRERKLDVVSGDAITYLQGLTDASLSAVTGFHFIEHVPFETLIKLLDETVRVVKPGGMVIFETPNPENVLVGSQYFYFDPTHRNPLPASVVQFLLESRGLTRVEVMRLHPAEHLRVEGEDELTERFNEYFFGPMDYAVTGRKL